VQECLAGRVHRENGLRVTLPELDALPLPRRLRVVACGTSYNAGLWGRHLLESRGGVPTEVEIASEFRYRDPLLDPDDMVLLVSQSGETTDTLFALRLARAKGCKVIALCNALGSSIAREADAVLYTQAGPEISVASTKAMCSQMTLLALLALYFGQRRTSPRRDDSLLESLLEFPSLLENALPALRETARRLAPVYAGAGSFFYLGRGPSYALALEGALKLKELSYIHAEGYAAGEMKHGPIALVDPDFPTFALALQDPLLPKTLSNIKEIQARRGKVIALLQPGCDITVDHPWLLPPCHPDVAPLLALPALQLFSYEIADCLGKDVDQPRNLAKSVTVE
jgi:glucosamine--fructose-6-phosphate aminotransferase (isomerizing)